MSFIQLIILAAIQGFAELLPVSSSAHVILAQKLMGLDPSAPEMTFLLVMLHTGTMFAVLVYFWKRWYAMVADKARAKSFVVNLVVATAVTGVLGLGAKIIIEKLIMEKWLGYPKGEVEALFRFLPLVGASLFVAGVYIIAAGLLTKSTGVDEISRKDSVWIGFSQGLCLPFRGLSRSGTTISTGLVRGISHRTSEDFSFALAVLLTPPVVLMELKRLHTAHTQGITGSLMSMVTPGLMGMVFSFIAGLIALRWLSSWLEKGRWHFFGFYCLAVAAVVFGVYFH